MSVQTLIKKYTGPGPRYTSYPTAPIWSDKIGPTAYAETLKNAPQSIKSGKELLGLYVHIPFCESLCYYCGCNIQITHDHARSGAYVQSLGKELGLVCDLLGGQVQLGQISWGGGTPTFLSLEEITTLFGFIKSRFSIDKEAEISIEVDPRVTSLAQLRLLRDLGFNRISLGVQDFNPAVQKAINREQSKEMAQTMLEECRTLGFKGINFDLIYGLPNQTLKTFEETIQQIIDVSPDRIALYNYARLPSLIKHQQILEKFPMPSAEERVEIFEIALAALQKAGYTAIGMDHFAKATDELATAAESGALYRNFMGYTVRRGKSYLGVGASAIGENWNGFFQNIKGAKEYEQAIERGELATLRGLVFSEEDKRRKWIIQSIMCGFRLRKDEYEAEFGEEITSRYPQEWEALNPFVDEGILSTINEGYKVTDVGRIFLRNVAMVWDAYFKPASTEKKTFSQTV